ncbi:MAG: two-component sensor histidine kinase [Actinomycetia bacterium]|nr:two-component sensor histidine kinase [Actinomycetes bacterium]
MSSAEAPPVLTVWSRVGVTFRLFMYLRVLLVSMGLVLTTGVPTGAVVVLLMAGIGAFSWLVARASERVLPTLARHPILLCLDAFAAYAVLQVAGVFGPFFLFTVITSALAGVLYEWRALLFVCSLQIAFYYLAAHAAPPGQHGADFQALIGLPVFYPIAGCAGIGLHRLFEQYADALEGRRRAETVAAAAEERARLAREMHDSLAKTLQGIALTVGVLPVWVRRSPDRAEQEARKIADAIQVAVGEARGLIADLREDGPSLPLGPTVRQIATAWGRRTGVPVVVAIEDVAEPPLIARYELVAILKEALTNVERHAAATTVEVSLTAGAAAVGLAVRDNGRGFDNPVGAGDWLTRLARDGHYGVVGMAERARRAGSELSVVSQPGWGTAISVALSVEAEHGAVYADRPAGAA